MALPPSPPTMAPSCTALTMASWISALDSGGSALPLATTRSSKTTNFRFVDPRSLRTKSRPLC
eukprot:9368806-Pyramimonas_sp.AAC.1